MDEFYDSDYEECVAECGFDGMIEINGEVFYV